MDWDTYLAHLHADAATLRDAATAAGPAAAVPTCPEWTVADLVAHTAAVYDDKIKCMVGGKEPTDFTGKAPEGTDPLDWFDNRLAALVAELTARGPEAYSVTWYPPDQTVGFWYRRMAQETLVHRIDAELAAGRTPAADEALALDGIDEKLRVFLANPWWEEHPWHDATGRTFAVRSGDRVWRVVSETALARIEDGPGDAVGEVSGTPYDVLMWVWGRENAATTTGDVAELRTRLALDS
jgi:uncharacterized protein (TIGR03083 family)